MEYRKPDKRSVIDWMERHQLASNQILVVDDQFVGAQLALNINARALLIKRNGDIPHLDTLTHHNHDNIFVVDNLDDVELTQ